MMLWVFLFEPEHWDFPAFPPLVKNREGIAMTPETHREWDFNGWKRIQRKSPDEWVIRIQKTMREDWEGIHIVGNVCENRWIEKVLKEQGLTPTFLYLDQFPSANLNWSLFRQIYVPSFFLRDQIQTTYPETVTKVELLDPIPIHTLSDWEVERVQRRDRLKKRYGLTGQFILLLERRYLRPGHLRKIRQATNDLKGVQCWVPGKKSEIRNLQDWRERYLIADWVLTTGDPIRSINSYHALVLSYGIPVLTTDEGDHSEWIRHGFNGLLLHSLKWEKELRSYLNLLIEKPCLAKEMGYNGRGLYEAFLCEREKGDDSWLI